MLQPFLHEALIFHHQSFSSKEELFSHIQQEALKSGYITEQFEEKIAEREKSFPTGLEVGNLNIAIPHTDPEYVLKQFIAIYTLKEPIKFRRMDDPSADTAVSIVFVLGLNEPHAQLEVLQDLMAKLQDQNFISDIHQATSIQKIIEKF
ncbi:PTS sugar transporter subunit IIA [Macrococcus bovicus]|uniref:PTS sugar transporter subunit IIA n=1 Tax=Macrococcus bovicus TaxID=69968 RepID=UPI0025A61F06|nr:PTS sugar transporter subunit IIA [Macrococcus bovicus]WJP97285.1 PTS sugar transporter subunit IIA [Macrococcus bovicus]